MSRARRNAIVVGLTWLLASAVVAAQEKPTRVETARWAAGLNAKSNAGRQWLDRHSSEVAKLLVPVLNRCVPDQGDEVTAFSVFVRLSRAGRVREVLTDLEPSLGSCMTNGARELQLPQPPRDDYWIQVNLATEL